MTSVYNNKLYRYKKTDSTTIQMTPLIRRKKSDKWFFKRKRYVIFFSILSIFFLYYQIISFIMLSWNASNDAESNYLAKNNNKISKEEIEFLKDQVSIYMPGVLSENSKNYIKTSNEFKCLKSGETILFSQINDHYCDCEDGTDEPSTSACPNNIFYCVQNTFNGKKFIHSNRVNDGICDCCEGSDEWLNVTNPIDFNDIQLNLIRTKSSTFITPCKNQCSKVN